MLRLRDARRPFAAAQHGHAQAQPQRPLRVGDGPVAHQAERGRDLGRVLGREAQQAAVEQRRLVEVVERLGQRHVVDVGDRDRSLCRSGWIVAREVGEPAVLGTRAAEEHRRAVRRGDGRQVRLGRTAGAGEQRGEQRRRPLRGGRWIVDLDADRRDGGAPSERIRARRLGVEQHPCLPVRPQLDGLGAVRAGAGEAERREGAGDRGAALVVDRDLGEREAVQLRGVGSARLPAVDEDAAVLPGAPRRVVGQVVVHRLVEREQRAQGVDGRAARVGLAEHVVEHLERQRPGVAGDEYVAEERGQVEGALAGEEAVVAAPLQHVHVHVRRVGQLQEEQLLARDVADAGGVAAAGEDVEAVDAQPQRRVVGAAHDLPRPVVGVDVPAPRQRLVRHAHTARRGPLGQHVQLLGDAAVVVDGVRRHRRAHQDQVRAQRLHDVELALGPPQVGREPLGIGGVEVAEGLVEIDREPEVRTAFADLRGGRRRRDEVRLEDLDAVEPGRGGRRELVLQRAGDADGGDRGARDAGRGQRVACTGRLGGHGHSGSPFGPAPLRHGKPSPAQPCHGGTHPVPAGGRFPASGAAGPVHHQPWRCAHTSIATDIADMNASSPPARLMCVLSLTMTFIP